MPPIWEELVELEQLVEQTVDVPFPQIMETVVEDSRILLHEQISERFFECIVS